MGLSIRIFIVEGDDTITRLPLACYERLHKRDPDERFLKSAGKRVRYTLIVNEFSSWKRNSRWIFDVELCSTAPANSGPRWQPSECCLFQLCSFVMTRDHRRKF